MIATSIQLGALPSFPPSQVVDWIPVDVAAATMLDIITTTDMLMPATSIHANGDGDGTEGVSTYNIVNPKPIPWSEFLEELQAALTQQNIGVPGADRLKVMPITEWTELLRLRAIGEDADNGDDTTSMTALGHSIPGIKLLNFFQDMATASVSASVFEGSSSAASPAAPSCTTPENNTSTTPTSPASVVRVSPSSSCTNQSGKEQQGQQYGNWELPQHQPRIFQTSKTEKNSPALKQCEPVNKRLLSKCIDAWEKAGVL
jgi:hypothetical protein